MNSALSRGVGYEPTPPGPRFSDERGAGYFIDFSSKTTAAGVGAPAEMLPADLAQLALGWWERLLDGEGAAENRFFGLCDVLADGAEVRGDEARWAYPVGDKKYGTSAPFYSAMAQAQAASVLVRAYVRRGDPRHAELALAAVRPLLGESDLVAVTAAGPVLEESPSTPPSHILNGWIYGLMGLWDVQLELADEAVADRYQASLGCLVTLLGDYDVGWWTRYSLYPHRIRDLAKPFYHRLHIHQMEALYGLTGFPEFAQAARRWRGYDTRLNTVRSLAQKMVFVGSGYR